MAGTIGKKVPLEVERINEGRPPTVIVLDDSGYHDGTKQWLLGKRKQRLMKGMDIGGVTRMYQKEVI